MKNFSAASEKKAKLKWQSVQEGKKPDYLIKRDIDSLNFAHHSRVRS